MVSSFQQICYNAFVVKFLGFYHYKSTKTILESSTVMIVIGGKAGDVGSVTKHGIEEYGIFPFSTFIDGIIVVTFNCPDALQSVYIFDIHTGPDRVIIGGKTALSDPRLSKSMERNSGCTDLIL